MTLLELSPEAAKAVEIEARRRGVGRSEILDEAVRRFVAGEGLRRMLKRFDAEDAANPDRLDDEQAMAIAIEEIAAQRAARRADTADS